MCIRNASLTCRFETFFGNPQAPDLPWINWLHRRLPRLGYFRVTLCDNYVQKPCNLNLQRTVRLYITVSDQNLEQLHPVLKSKTAVGGDSNIRLKLKDFFADILCDRRSRPEIWHWIVQRNGCPEILNWGHESSQERAEEEARAYLESLVNLRQFKEKQAI